MNTELKEHAVRYIKACKENRLMCNITHVSASGMTRHMKFFEMNKSNKQYHVYNFWYLFNALGYKSKRDSFVVGGCGMDMVFATHYNIIHKLHNLGYISKQQCAVLAQKTPIVV